MNACPVLVLDTKRFKTLFSLLGKVKYKLAVKPILSAAPKYVTQSDCSGFVRYMIYLLTGKRLPEGSYDQRKWCEAQGFKSYGREGYAENAGQKDGRLRLAFIDQHGAAGSGHVWFVLDGVTYECYGGHGVGSRAWNAPIEGGKTSLSEAVDHCFVLTEPG